MEPCLLKLDRQFKLIDQEMLVYFVVNTQPLLSILKLHGTRGFILAQLLALVPITS